MAPLYFPKLFPVNSEAMLQNEMTLICAKFGADAVNTSKVTSRETQWPRFVWPTLHVGKPAIARASEEK